MPPPTLVMQTTYAELLERSAVSAFATSFSDDGTFISKTIKGRVYWYFQHSTDNGRTQKYVGPETRDLLERITKHKEARDDERERRALVSTLVRSFGLTRPIPEIGTIVAALASEGTFRLRGVLVGTVAYQTYPAMLGAKLPTASLQTGDIDIAQFKNLSIAVEDRTSEALSILKQVDKTFRAVPHIHDNRSVTTYAAKGGLRVDFLTPNEGPDTDDPQPLPAFGTDAQPLRFLDFLIHDPEPAVVLHDAGIYVLVPAPQRYAVHKLIVSRRRREGTAKREKDIEQAENLLEILIQRRKYELKAAWDEARRRGHTWWRLMTEGLSLVTPEIRDNTLKCVGVRRAELPNMQLTFNNPVPHYDFNRDVIDFEGEGLGKLVQCTISREALDDHFGDSKSNDERIEKFLNNRSRIEELARKKYLTWPVETAESVLIRTDDVSRLTKEIPAFAKINP